MDFTEAEVNAPERFDSRFMAEFIGGKLGKIEESESNFELGFEIENSFIPTKPLEFSPEAKAVFATGRELWKYYHKEPNCNVNASLYDIKAHFQGQNELGRMNNQSKDEKYNLLIDNLRQSLEVLAQKIQLKVYEFGFLRGVKFYFI